MAEGKFGVLGVMAPRRDVAANLWQQWQSWKPHRLPRSFAARIVVERFPLRGLLHSYDPVFHQRCWQLYYNASDPSIVVPPLPLDVWTLRDSAIKGEIPVFVAGLSLNVRRFAAHGLKLEAADVFGWGGVPLSPNTPFLGSSPEDLADRFAERGGWCIAARGYEVYGDLMYQELGRFPDDGKWVRFLAGSSWGKDAVAVRFQRGRIGKLEFRVAFGPELHVGGRYFRPWPA